MARILVVEDSPTQAQQIQFLLEDAGYTVEVAGDGKKALGHLERQLPDLVVTDLEMPEMNGLQLVEEVRSRFPAVPVVLMTAYGSEEIAALALKKGATSYVPKRYLGDDIVATVGNILSVSGAEREHERVLLCLNTAEVRFALENDESLIPPLIGYLEGLLTQMKLYDQTSLIRVCVALREALINAMHHGNLEVSSALRETDDREYHRLLEERRKQSPYKDRRVFVTATVSRIKAEYTIRDEGPGFDPATLPDPTDPVNLERVSGRGLFLIRTFMDQVDHSEDGNQITMVKRSDR